MGPRNIGAAGAAATGAAAGTKAGTTGATGTGAGATGGVGVPPGCENDKRGVSTNIRRRSEEDAGSGVKI